MQQSQKQNEQQEYSLEQMPNQQVFSQATNFSRHCVDYFQKYVCTQFAAHKQFLQLQHCAQVVSSIPQFQPTISRTLRDNLKVERQIQYLKASLHQSHIYSTIEQQLNQQLHYEPIKRLGSILFQHQGRLYWGFGSKLMTLRVQDVIKYQKPQQKTRLKQKQSFQVTSQQGVQLLDLAEPLLQLKLTKNLIIIRTARKIFLYNIQSSNLLNFYTFSNQILAIWTTDSRQYIYVSLSKGNESLVQLIDLQANQRTQINCRIANIHSGWNIASSSVVCSYDSLHFLDFRVQFSQSLRVCEPNSRIFAGLSLGGKSFSQNYCITSQSFQAKIFDLRFANRAICQISHFCEQNPPTILSLYQPQFSTLTVSSKNIKQLILQQLIRSRKINPLVVATSPYSFGSSIYSEIPACFQNPKYETSPFQGFGLLFDKGKFDKMYHPLSSTVISLESYLAFLHLDNFGGLSLQIFSHENSEQMKNQRVERRLKRIEFNKQRSLEEINNPNSVWLTRHRLETYLKQNIDREWGNIISQDSMDLQLEDNNLKQKYLRYADLKSFYSKLVLSQPQINVQGSLRQEQKEVHSLLKQAENRTQSIFQTIGSTFSDAKQIGNNKIIISHTILDDLNKEWDQSDL